MRDALVAVAAAVLLVAAGLAALLALTLVPFVTAVGLAERARLGTARWGVVAGLCSALGLAVAYVSLRHGLGPLVVALGVLATWTAPVALLALGGAGGRLAGARGRHE